MISLEKTPKCWIFVKNVQTLAQVSQTKLSSLTAVIWQKLLRVNKIVEKNSYENLSLEVDLKLLPNPPGMNKS